MPSSGPRPPVADLNSGAADRPAGRTARRTVMTFPAGVKAGLPVLAVGVTAGLLGLAGLWGTAGTGASDVSAAAKPAAKKKGGRHNEMDYGPFVSATIGELIGGKNDTSAKYNNAHKGIVARLTEDGTAAFCFDTDLCRMQSVWTGGYLHLRGTPFDGSHGSWPAAAGDVLARTAPGLPGWAKPGTDEFKDARPEPYGPMPAEWVKYRGLHRHGQRVVFHYTVGETKVSESASALAKDGATVIVRTLNVGPTKAALVLAAGTPAEAPASKIVLSGAPAGVALADGKVKLPASDKPVAFALVYGTADNVDKLAASVPAAEDLAPLAKGGPALWTETVTTEVQAGTSKSPDGAWEVDTLTLPETNPYKSWMRLGGMDFFADGKRAAVSTWSGDVWIVSGIGDPAGKLVWRRYAAGLYQALGLRIVGDVVYVNGRDQITRLHDVNGDGEADHYECFNNDHTTSTAFHEFVFDLQSDAEGNFYYSHGGGVNPGGRGFQPNPAPAHHGCLIKVSKDGSKSEVWATGFRAPNGIGVGPDGTVTAGDNEGTWMPQCRLSLVGKGSFNGCVSMAHRPTAPTTFDPPIAWLSHKDIDNSGGGQTWVDNDKWGLPKGTLLHTSYGKSSLYHTAYEVVDGIPQGGVVRMPVNFLSGICRPRFNAVDGHLYVAGLKGWQTNGARDGALHRVRWTGKPYVTVTGVRFAKKGVTLTFNKPLDKSTAADPEAWGFERWNYVWSQNYGSPEVQVGDAKKKGRETVAIKGVTLSEDGLSATIDIGEVVPSMQIRIRGKFKSAAGDGVNLDFFGTINKPRE